MARRCCCVRGCLICFDNFYRDDNTDLGDEFVEASGNWWIKDNMLWEAGGANGVAYCPTRHPVATWTAVAGVAMHNMAIGNEYILFVNFDPASPTDIEGVKYVCDTDTTGTLSLIPMTDISASGIPYDTDEILTVCRNLNALWGEVTGGALVYDTIADRGAKTRRYAGVKNPGSNDVYFDDFSYSEHHNTNSICNCCPCACGAGVQSCAADISIPRKVLATFYLSGGECLPCVYTWYHLLEAELEIETTLLEEIIWRGTTSGPDEICSGASDVWDITLHCVSDSFHMEITANSVGGGPVARGLADFVCNPLSLTFGSWHMTNADDCWLTIIITEVPA